MTNLPDRLNDPRVAHHVEAKCPTCAEPECCCVCEGEEAPDRRVRLHCNCHQHGHEDHQIWCDRFTLEHRTLSTVSDRVGELLEELLCGLSLKDHAVVHQALEQVITREANDDPTT